MATDINYRKVSVLGLYVEVDLATQYATVYRKDTDAPEGTLTRKRVLSRDPFEWTISNIEGHEVFKSNTVAFALRMLAADIEKRERRNHE